MPSAVTTDNNPPTSPSATHRRASLKVLSRNIDKVALGNLVFPTWYYSPYPDSIIHDQELSTITVKSEPNNHTAGAPRHDGKHAVSTREGVNGTARYGQTTSAQQYHHHAIIPNEKAFLSMLHVCPYCFRYTHSPLDFTSHLALHVKNETEYHSRRTKLNQKRKSKRRRSASQSSDAHRKVDQDDEDDDAPRPVPESAIKVYSHEGYTVWDIDGETEKLYCQNLSLFGKLFLEQKSVFFDTAGFHYFVLTYCPPSTATNAVAESTIHDSDAKKETKSPKGDRANKESKTSSQTSTSPSSTRKRRKSNAATEDPSSTVKSSSGSQYPTLDQPSFPLRHQVLGFFSKENLSWDSNNLACILVFPPYQHRNLGQLLMAVSYKLSGWEWEDSIIGGPEKPLSTMGRKSYLHFWSERIARFIMGQSQDAEGLRVFEEGVMQETEDEDGLLQQVMTGKKRKRKHGRGFLKDELSIKELGDRTGMLGEDVAAALVEMGVCDLVPSANKKKKQSQQQSQQHKDSKVFSATTASNKDAANANSKLTINTPGLATDDHNVMSVTVSRSRVLDWAKRHGVDMISSVKEEGFLGEWALSEGDSEDEDAIASANDGDDAGGDSNQSD